MNGTLYMWGDNLNGMIGQGTAVLLYGDGNLSPFSEPQPVPGNYTYFAMGWPTVCALDHDSAIWCWGADQWGNLLQGSIVPYRGLGPWSGLAVPTKAVVPLACGADPKFRKIAALDNSPWFAVTYSGVLIGWVSAGWGGC